MTQPEIFTFAATILALIDECPLKVGYLAKGATCDVWLVQSTGGKFYALRIIDDDVRVVDGVLDQFIRDAMLKRGGRVGGFVVSSETTGVVLHEKRWGLDAFIAGHHPERGALTDVVCRHLGETLATLHAIPVQKFGRLSSVQNGVVIGEIRSPIEGIKQRFENPLPETWEASFNHPILQEIPNLADEILTRLALVTHTVKQHKAVICHTDLHEKQILCTETGLAALIDFGGATILDRHWDLGSVYYFHGKDNFAKFYDAYLGKSGADPAPVELVPAFSIAIAMHHASRARLPGKHHRLTRAIDHIQRVLSN